MRVQLDATKIHDPGEPSRIVHDDLLRYSARRERQRNRSKPRWPFIGRTFLIKRLCLGAVNKTFENDRAILDSSQRAGCNGKVIVHEIEFGDSRLRRKIQLLGIRDLNFTSFKREHLAGSFFCQEIRLSPMRDGGTVELEAFARPVRRIRVAHLLRAG
jgi:hypothetical protein